MKTFFKSILTIVALAMFLSVSTAYVSAPAMADEGWMCGNTPSGTC